METTKLFVVTYRLLGSGHSNYWIAFIAMKPYTGYLNTRITAKKCSNTEIYYSFEPYLSQQQLLDDSAGSHQLQLHDTTEGYSSLNYICT